MNKIDGVGLIDRDFEILKILEKKSGYKAKYSEALSDYMDIGFFAYENKVKALIITEYTFESFPKDIFKLVDLDTLVIMNIKEVDLDNIEVLSSLEFLTIRSCDFVNLPNSIGKLKNLKELEISYSNLISIPKTIGDLISLETLDLEGNQIRVLPESLGNLLKLKRINLLGNNLISLPKSLEKLGNLDLF